MSPKNRQQIENDVADIMMEFGPDRHTDGADKIADYIMALLITTETRHNHSWWPGPMLDGKQHEMCVICGELKKPK